MSETWYVDRATGMRLREPVFGGATLDVLYGTRLGRLATSTLISRRRASSLYGWWQRMPRSARNIPAFIAALEIDAGEAELPLDQYRSFDEFFARRLRPGARQIDMDSTHLLSPCDGRLLAYQQVPNEFLVKSSTVDLGTLLRDADLARRFASGSAVIIRLAPADYHRFHFPTSGIASHTRPIGGRLHSVHPIALSGGAPSFKNKRHVTTLQSESFGMIAMIEVGALCVGTIQQGFHAGSVTAGAEKGTFRFGGSTIVLAFEPGRVVLDRDLLDNTSSGIETLVHMGTRIGITSST